jgi:hypothetical protein
MCAVAAYRDMGICKSQVFLTWNYSAHVRTLSHFSGGTDDRLGAFPGRRLPGDELSCHSCKQAFTSSNPLVASTSLHPRSQEFVCHVAPVTDSVEQLCSKSISNMQGLPHLTNASLRVRDASIEGVAAHSLPAPHHCCEWSLLRDRSSKIY